MKQVLTAVPVMVLAALFNVQALAETGQTGGDAGAGKTKAAACAACHGNDGISVYEAWPNLAGQDAQYLVAQLKAYKEGTRNSPMMYPMVFDLTETDMSDLAAYYSDMPCP